MKIADELEYRVLRRLKPRDEHPSRCEPNLSYVPKIKRIVGDRGWEELRDKTILDFGCGHGIGCIEMAQHGAKAIIGLDIRSEVLDVARKYADEAGVADICRFVEPADERIADPVDVILSVDAFEHFDDPSLILGMMDRLLKDDGSVLLSFGPTWYHPRGGHLFSVFPWSHLIFSERAQIRWRSDFKQDGATRFSEVSGGLNLITIKRFEKFVRHSAFQFESIRTIPIKPLAWAHNRLTREFTTSVIECKLVKKRANHAKCSSNSLHVA